MAGVLRQTMGIEGMMFWAGLTAMGLATVLIATTAVSFDREHAAAD